MRRFALFFKFFFSGSLPASNTFQTLTLASEPSVTVALPAVIQPKPWRQRSVCCPCSHFFFVAVAGGALEWQSNACVSGERFGPIFADRRLL